jgi:hypothetical protein
MRDVYDCPVCELTWAKAAVVASLTACLLLDCELYWFTRTSIAPSDDGSTRSFPDEQALYWFRSDTDSWKVIRYRSSRLYMGCLSFMTILTTRALSVPSATASFRRLLRWYTELRLIWLPSVRRTCAVSSLTTHLVIVTKASSPSSIVCRCSARRLSSTADTSYSRSPTFPFGRTGLHMYAGRFWFGWSCESMNSYNDSRQVISS